MNSSQTAEQLRGAVNAGDIDRTVKLLQGVRTADPEGRLESLTVPLLQRSNRSVRNAAAIALADLQSSKAPAAITAAIANPATKGARGSLLYALAELNASLALAILVDVLIDDSMEAREEAIRALEQGRVRFDTAEILPAVSKVTQAIEHTPDPDARELLQDAAGLIAGLAP